jgi:hypothetical protein
VAVKGLSVAMAFLAANPIVLVIAAIVALGVGLVIAYQKVEWFRNAVNALGRILMAVFGGAVRAVMTAFSGWWATNGDMVIQVCNAVGAAFRWLGGVIAGYLGGVVANFRQFASLLSAIWVPLWELIRFVATSYFNYVMLQLRIAWAIITGIFQVGAAVIQAVWGLLWNTILYIGQVTWAAIQALVRIGWNIIVGLFTVGLNLITGNWSGAWDAMRQYGQQVLNALTTFFRSWWSATSGLWSGQLAVLKNLWSSSWQAMSNTATSIGNAIRDFMTRLWQQINAAAGAGWNGIVNTIANAWNRVRDAVAGPARWVVQSIINPLIRGINTLISKIGISEIPQIPGFAEGGKIPGHGRGDRQLILAEAGEWMLTRAQARAFGYGNLARLPRYAEGGPIGHIPPEARLPSWIPTPGDVLSGIRGLGSGFAGITHIADLARAGKDLVDSFLPGFLTWAASEAFRLLTGPLRKAVEPWASDPVIFPKQWLGKLTLSILDKAVEFIAGKALGPCASFGGGDVGGIVGAAMKYNGRPYRWGGGANPSTGFDCSSFVSYIAGHYGKLPLPGGFRAPSPAHGPVTTDYLGWGGMRTVSLSQAGPGAVAVSPSHIGFIIGPGGSGFAARSTATGIGPQNFARGYTYRIWNQGGSAGQAEGGADGGDMGVCDVGLDGPGQGGPENVRRAITQAAGMLGIPWAINAFMAQARTESNFNARAINNWDSNARAGTPSKGVLQVIDPTFAAYCGPFCSRGIWDILANVYAGMNYAKSRYGARLLQVIGHGHGYAEGGVIGEPVFGLGLRTGAPYSFGERGPELVSPLSGPGYPAGGGGGARIVINVHPTPGMDERQVAAAVSRELAWAYAGGVR